MSDSETSRYLIQRYKEFMENIEDRPYWQWVGVEDPSMCDDCRELHEKVFMFDDPIWVKMLQLFHKGCRCRFRALSEKNLKDRGLKVTRSIDILGDNYHGSDPKQLNK